MIPAMISASGPPVTIICSNFAVGIRFIPCLLGYFTRAPILFTSGTNRDCVRRGTAGAVGWVEGN
jgi:hypothetical protein